MTDQPTGTRPEVADDTTDLDATREAGLNKHEMAAKETKQESNDKE